MLEREHGLLVDCVVQLNGSLQSFERRIDSGDAAHHQHLVFAQRANALRLYLDAAITLVRSDLYPPAFALLRAALEHQIIDTLVFLARRYVHVVQPVDEVTWRQWQADRAAGADWAADIVEWQRQKTRVTIVRSGPHASDTKPGPRTASVSMYYFLLDDFHPLTGHPDNQPHLNHGFIDAEHYVDLARQNQRLYRHALRWSALKDNLRINKLYSLRALAQLDVHYTFLSSYVHSTHPDHQNVYGRSWAYSELPRYDHYASELCLLYCVVIACAELDALIRMSRRAPRATLRNWESTAELIARARRLSGHLWFPPKGQPHDFDRIEESNRRAGKSWGTKRFSVVDPKSLSGGSVRYYRDPFRRLIQMHRSSTEFVTGLTYRSPWERTDAQLRG
jgi:hypothetical protein